MQPIEIILTPTFNKSLARLTPQEQKQVDLAVMQFWRTPDAPGLRWHSLNMREKRFYSISPNMDLRVIVMADGDSWPDFLQDSNKVTYWDITDPVGLGDEGALSIYNEIKRRVEELVVETG